MGSDKRDSGHQSPWHRGQSTKTPVAIRQRLSAQALWRRLTRADRRAGERLPRTLSPERTRPDHCVGVNPMVAYRAPLDDEEQA
jgi:hypothetical protein